MAASSYTAVVEKEGDGYLALRPELDVAGQGATVRSDSYSERSCRIIPGMRGPRRSAATAAYRSLCDALRSNAWLTFGSSQDARTARF